MTVAEQSQQSNGWKFYTDTVGTTTIQQKKGKCNTGRYF